jgi:hypothetical protein
MCIFLLNVKVRIEKDSKHNNGKARSREDHGASPSLWKEYCRKTRQTIQVGSGNLHVGKLNQMPQEKNISK